MPVRKITVDNNVKYIPQSEQTRERDIKPHTVKNTSLPKKQNKKLSQNNAKFITNYQQKVSALLYEQPIVTFNKNHRDTLIEQTKAKP